MDTDSVKVACEAAKEVAKAVYDDIGKPVLKPTGEFLALIPRAIKVAFSPLEKWLLHEEYSISETKKLLEEKLKNVSPENIVPPEPHIAIPALQYISYCMDNEELRNMYANLLANSMNKTMKNGVHPGFVEIIKQLCPDEAKVLKEFHKIRYIPTITIRYKSRDKGSLTIIANFSDIGEISGCEKPYDVQGYFDNLERLGLIETEYGTSMMKKELYDTLKQHPFISSYLNLPDAYKIQGFTELRIDESFFGITAYGSSFCKICINS